MDDKTVIDAMREGLRKSWLTNVQPSVRMVVDEHHEGSGTWKPTTQPGSEKT